MTIERTTLKLAILHAIILVIAICLRLYFVNNITWIARSDTRDFHEYALNLLSGKGFLCDWHEHPAWQGFVSRQVHAPGYPLLLAAIYKITGFNKDVYLNSPMARQVPARAPLIAAGFNPIYPLYFNILLDAISMICLVLLCRHRGLYKESVIAQLLYLPFVFWTPILIAETAFITCFISFITICSIYEELSSYLLSFMKGLILGAAFMIKPIAVTLIPIVLVQFLKVRTLKAMLHGVVIAVPIALVVLFMFYRSYTYYGEYFYISTGGQHLADNSFSVDKNSEYVALANKLGRVPNESEVNTYFYGRVRQIIAEDPWVGIKAYFRNMIGLFSLKPPWNMQWIWNAGFFYSESARNLHMMLFNWNYLIYPLGIIGFIIYFRMFPYASIAIMSFLVIQPASGYGTYRYFAPIAALFPLYGAALIGKIPAWMAIQRTAQARSGEILHATNN
ncbi:MAG: hypothetical protein KKC51_12385 [Verrucomicrobia bacterium]|nr:hypothetical protein [Verrucomicrobiota bacterium]